MDQILISADGVNSLKVSLNKEYRHAYGFSNVIQQGVEFEIHKFRKHSLTLNVTQASSTHQIEET